MARVILADDHPLFLAAVKTAVEEAGVTVAATAERGDQLLEVAAQTPVDAILLDLAMPGLDGFQCLEVLSERHPDTLLIVVSATDDQEKIRRALDLGAVCFVGKATEPHELAGAVTVLLSDAIHLRARTARNGAAPDPTPSPEAALLTPRELEILRFAAEGRSNAEIARTVWVTEQTVKFHLSNIYRKLNVPNRASASRWAHRHGLLDESA